MRAHLQIAFILAALLFVTPGQAEKIKTYWTGSGMSVDGPRTVSLQLSADGTAVLQTTKGDEATKFHARWRKEGKNIVLTFDPSADGTTPAPMGFEFKKNSLIPRFANNPALGAFAYPTLTPFGEDAVNINAGASGSCTTGQATNCAQRQTWSSGTK
jgi:hypothetical protein